MQVIITYLFTAASIQQVVSLQVLKRQDHAINWPLIPFPLVLEHVVEPFSLVACLATVRGTHTLKGLTLSLGLNRLPHNCMHVGMCVVASVLLHKGALLCMPSAQV